MQLIFFCHPPFMQSQSMPRFARMIGEAMSARGHEVEYWAPKDRLYKLLKGSRLASLAKWAGYIDQYVLFPLEVRFRLLPHRTPHTLYVFCDQALGPWVPLVTQHPHVVHAHDLLALRSALGLIPQNPTSLTGRIYQRYIRSGFRRARHFISVSFRTKEDLQTYGHIEAASSDVVYNGLNYPYRRMGRAAAASLLEQAGLSHCSDGHILHIGGGQWYKNTAGVIRLYAHHARRRSQVLPLLMISPNSDHPDVLAALATVPAHGSVTFRQGLNNEQVCAAYSLAEAFLFPSLAEGFGWPIIEAQACGCPVITTNDAPMNEIGGPFATYLPVLQPSKRIDEWAEAGSLSLDELIDAGAAANPTLQAQRVNWAAQFTNERAIDAYERIYGTVLQAN